MDPVLITTSALTLFQLALKLREEAIRAGEWTPEQEQQYANMTAASFKASQWKKSGRKPKGK